MFHTHLHDGWYYLVRGRSTVVYKNADTGVVIASKDQNVIQALADKLNSSRR